MTLGKQIGQFEGHHTSVTIDYGYFKQLSRYRKSNQKEAYIGTKTAKTPWVGFIVTGLILYFINLILHFI